MSSENPFLFFYGSERPQQRGTSTEHPKGGASRCRSLWSGAAGGTTPKRPNPRGSPLPLEGKFVAFCETAALSEPRLLPLARAPLFPRQHNPAVTQLGPGGRGSWRASVPHPLPSAPPRGSNYTRLIIKVSLASAAAPGERSSLSPSRGTERGMAWGARLARGAQAPQGNSGALVSPVTILCPIFSLPLPRAIWGSSCGWLFARPHALPGWQGARGARGCATGSGLGTRTPGL